MADQRNPSGEKPWPAERPAEPEIKESEIERENIVGEGDRDEDVDPDSAESDNDRDDMLTD